MFFHFVEVFSKIAFLEEEMNRLQIQAEEFAPFVEASLKKMKISPKMKVADIGCGTGDVCFAVSKIVGPKGSVIGVDANQTAVKYCKTVAKRRVIRNTEFVVGDAQNTQLPSHAFDAVYSRFLFQHLKNPVACLKEMVRIAKPAGVVMVEDCDLSKWVVEPANRYVEQLWTWYEGIMKAKGSDPSIGKKLYRMFVDAGMKPQVEIYSLPVLRNNRRVWDTILGVLTKIDDGDSRELIQGIESFANDKNSLFVFPLVFRVWAKASRRSAS
ncbi:MAG TPA: methyltransferase domain-containing protein [Candidatus Hodarchaeales archaeon]|nr:methyltransferase domain-containing protein [Candidatus Hodarchaeales archaeon]